MSYKIDAEDMDVEVLFRFRYPSRKMDSFHPFDRTFWDGWNDAKTHRNFCVPFGGNCGFLFIQAYLDGWNFFWFGKTYADIIGYDLTIP